MALEGHLMSFASNAGTHIHYEVEGHGPPLLLHHGFSENLGAWYRKGFVEALRDSYRLILIDVRGHGASDKPHSPDAYGLEQYATDVVAVLDALGIDQAHYFGYSLGGWTGCGMAIHAPGRLRSLAIGGAHPFGASLAIYRTMLQGDLESCLAFIETAAGTPLPEAARRDFFGNDIQALRAAYLRDRPDVSTGISLLQIPCLLFAGEADPLYEGIRRCATEILKASFLSVPALNHVQLALQLRQVLPPLMEFLAG